MYKPTTYSVILRAKSQLSQHLLFRRTLKHLDLRLPKYNITSHRPNLTKNENEYHPTLSPRHQSIRPRRMRRCFPSTSPVHVRYHRILLERNLRRCQQVATPDIAPAASQNNSSSTTTDLWPSSTQERMWSPATSYTRLLKTLWNLCASAVLESGKQNTCATTIAGIRSNAQIGPLLRRKSMPYVFVELLTLAVY